MNRRWRWSNVPIPGFYVLFLLAGVLLQLLGPLTLLPSAWAGQAIGPVLAMGGLTLGAWTVATAGATDISKPGALIVGGPYAWSRNPMYVAWALIHTGVALFFNSIWLAAFLPLAFVLTHFFAVLREEAQLESAFGDEYRRYRQRVRRYL